MVILFLLILALLLIAGPFFKTTTDITDAKAFVMEDLKTTYPNADIEIISTKEITNENSEKYYEIKTKVTQNQGSLCPERTHIYYNYPEQNFVPKTPEYITKDCVVCKETTCNIAFPEEAIIASHTLVGAEDVHNFIVGHAGMKATATEYDGGWTVVWATADGKEGVEVKVLTKGEIWSKSFFTWNTPPA
jgi:hypothetical protein